MIRSMTGFGLSESFDKTSNISIEIRGVNHRFLELSIKSSELGNDIEDFIREGISKSINRGKIEVKIKAKSSSKTKYDINKKLLKMLEKSLEAALKDKVNLNFSDIKDVPGIFNIETSKSVDKKLIKNCFNKALRAFVDSRKKEGKRIENVLLKKTKSIESIALRIQKLEKKTLNKKIKNYKNKIKKLIEDFDETRLDQEVAMLALKHDISEELDRIFFHTKSIKEEFKKKTSSGKKIDFILQELFRESNTLSVKIDDSKLKDLALDMKLLIEEMREQTQNVE